MTTTSFPYICRWNRQGRKGQPCRITARSRDRKPGVPVLPGIQSPAPRAFNSILVEFADGFRMVTSGNAIRRRTDHAR